MIRNTWVHVVAVLSAMMDERHRRAVEYLKEENRVLRERLGEKRVRLTNAQRRRLAVKAKALGRKALGEITDLFSPDTILGWYRKLVAQKYDGSANRKGGRPKVSGEIIDLVVRLANLCGIHCGGLRAGQIVTTGSLMGLPPRRRTSK